MKYSIWNASDDSHQFYSVTKTSPSMTYASVPMARLYERYNSIYSNHFSKFRYVAATHEV